MDGVTIRAFCLGLEPGQSVSVEIDGKPVVFSFDAAQVDVPTEAKPESATE